MTTLKFEGTSTIEDIRRQTQRFEVRVSTAGRPAIVGEVSKAGKHPWIARFGDVAGVAKTKPKAVQAALALYEGGAYFDPSWPRPSPRVQA